MSKTIKKEKFVPRRDEAAMTLVHGGFRNSHHGDKRKHDSKNECRKFKFNESCLLYTSPSPRDRQKSRMPSSA